MADSKVSELVTATTLGGSDLFYIVQTNTSKKVSAGTLFANASNVTLKGTVTLDPNEQLLAAPGIIDTTKQITHLSVDVTGGPLRIPSGLENQIKVVALIASSGGTYTLSGNIDNNANVVFNNVGDTATLLFTNNKWFVIGGTASIT
jgi:hypothetical protein